MLLKILEGGAHERDEGRKAALPDDILSSAAGEGGELASVHRKAVRQKHFDSVDNVTKCN